MSEPEYLELALLTEVFPLGEEARLTARLHEARERGARLAVLPELPLDRWAPARRRARAEDAEPPGGPRHRAQAGAARSARIALLGGAIVADPESGERRNRALLFDDRGELVACYDKVHLPSEEGFWESDHYRPGRRPPRPADLLAFGIGIQICSDVMRPTGCQLLAAQGAEVIFAPRATPTASYPRWLKVLTANAVTSACFVVSVNRPRPEAGVEIGGPSVVIAPDGELLLETTEPLAVTSLERARLSAARADYPGYLDRFPGLYAEAWAAVARRP